MSFETSKSLIRRSFDRRFATRWLVGSGIDIGAGNDSLGAYASMFPLIKSVLAWDIPNGDATLMKNVPDENFDFVNSSHCLEHLIDPSLALINWIRICKPDGHLLLIVPDEDLYEQGVWPSTYNADHKWSFTIGKTNSWSPKSINVIDFLRPFCHKVDILKIELLDSGYFYGIARIDQTQKIMGESAIEIILRRKRE
jgi:SAM-dependent methyltransferase